jgi:hypothetical protein
LGQAAGWVIYKRRAKQAPDDEGQVAMGKNINSSSSTILPKYIEDETKDIIADSRKLGEKPYPNFKGPKVAGFTPDQMAAFDMTRGVAGAWKPYTDFASKTWTDPGVAASYMNPYEDAAVEATLGDIYRSGDITRRGIGASMLASNAWGDDRHAILEAEFDRNLADVAAKTAAQMRNAGYAQAQQAFGADRAAQLSLAQLVPGLAYADAGARWNIGAQQQAQTQKNYDQALADFAAQVGWPYEMLNWRASLLQGTPYPVTTESKVPKQGGGDLASILGLAATGVGLAGDVLGGGSGGLLGGIRSLWGG